MEVLKKIVSSYYRSMSPTTHFNTEAPFVSKPIMEVQYHQFCPESTENTPETLHRGISKIVVYALYAVLLLLLFILLFMTGVKFSQISSDVNEIKIKLSKAANNVPFTPNHAHFEAHSETERIIEQVYLEEITPVRGNCREGWVSYDKGCYFLSATPEPWRNAETHCQRLNGHLLVINNVEELDYISKVVALGENYWIGLVERHKEGHWSWVDGSDYSSIQTFWDKGQPDDWDYRENGEDCGQLHSSVRRKRKLWNDADCSLAYRYICESTV
ncbi:asialoglycoprotein receptor-like 1 isoform X2 [Boleophthalmus pectinirostris]|uniref:asialoglycoprotein receptor-like 1 isoform X2 n=1 Tax=Boleophthalmus pectinirostris TaxID=150288 RepID=UPI0024321005|nr:asialoglycoprotein receptor-like 1 isoform X2 [Boleophthalmus pectinirostris]